MFVDTRVGSKDLMDHSQVSELAELTTLKFGDVSFTGNGPEGDCLVGVEIKSLSDLISSLETERLQVQIRGMVEEYEVSYLAYYGYSRCSSRDGSLQVFKNDMWVDYTVGSGRRYSFSYLQSALCSIEAAGVRVVKLNDKVDLVSWLRVSYDWFQKPWKDHKLFMSVGKPVVLSSRPLKERLRLRAKVASCLPGIGSKRALSVAQFFPSILSMICAPSSTWQGIDGISPKVADNVVDTILDTRD
jgi:ERCC4-type nuclease